MLVRLLDEPPISVIDMFPLRFGSGKLVDLPPASEEVAGFYAALLETEHAQDKTFNANFFDAFLKVLKKNPPVRIPTKNVNTSTLTRDTAGWDKDNFVGAVRLQTDVRAFRSGESQEESPHQC